jgi:hypothetical protein
MKMTFVYKEQEMNILLTAITIATLSVCGPQTATIKEDLSVKKNENSFTKNKIVYKKVPTKWVKITKKSN